VAALPPGRAVRSRGHVASMGRSLRGITQIGTFGPLSRDRAREMLYLDRLVSLREGHTGLGGGPVERPRALRRGPFYASGAHYEAKTPSGRS
jgi:hypothetical protein